MKKIKIQYDANQNAYYYDCPFCGKRIVCTSGDWDHCEHAIYGYEEINQGILMLNNEIYTRIKEILMAKRINFLAGLNELWNYEYQPQERRSTDPDTWDEEKEAAIDAYLDMGFSTDDLMKVFRCSDLKPMLDRLIVAETDEDSDGFGKTYFVLSDKTIE